MQSGNRLYCGQRRAKPVSIDSSRDDPNVMTNNIFFQMMLIIILYLVLYISHAVLEKMANNIIIRKK